MKDDGPVRVLLVDDHAVVRSGYRLLLQYQGGYEVVGEAANADEAYLRYRELRPTVTVMDVMMVGASGIEAVRRIVALDADARILVFSMCSQPAIVRQALQAGALGVLTKDSPPEALMTAISAVARGRRHLGSTVAETLALEPYSPGGRQFEMLSPREFEVCRLLLTGMTVERIADELKLSPKTVSNRLSAARQKLEVDSDVAMARLAANAGLIAWETTAPLD
ncbi:response regulator [Derxia lacustris]|uniref:response regulator n=1 Tax=Derxia lacustris TaxID=764842 RepID=UPI000A172D17|nr:response regulator transcription factor [Derxia lacustris]